MIGLIVPVLAKCKTDKSEHHQDGSGYHQPMRILHRGFPISSLSAQLYKPADGGHGAITHLSTRPSPRPSGGPWRNARASCVSAFCRADVAATRQITGKECRLNRCREEFPHDAIPLRSLETTLSRNGRGYPPIVPCGVTSSAFQVRVSAINLTRSPTLRSVSN